MGVRPIGPKGASADLATDDTAVAIFTPSPLSSAAASVCNKVGAVRALFPVRIADWVNLFAVSFTFFCFRHMFGF